MQLEGTFAVDAPIETVWLTLMDFEKVAGCVPGAQILSKLSADAYQVGMKVKLGPITMQYRGQLQVVERDAVGHRAVLSGTAKEARGQGTAQATATLSLVEEARTTRGSVSADVALSGRAAAMGQSIVGAVTDQMMAQFAQNLQVMLSEEGPAIDAAQQAITVPAVEAAEDPTAPDVANEATGATTAPEPATPVTATTPALSPAPAARPAASPPSATDSLNALTLARGMLRAQLANPRSMAAIVAAVALVSYQLGRRASRREHARWPGLGRAGSHLAASDLARTRARAQARPG